MACVVFPQDDLFAVRVVLVSTCVLALFDQMLVHLLDLNNLVALPAGHKHRTFFPVVDVD
jgi:hypothetical protein